MKKLFFSLLLGSICAVSTYAQDLIIKKDGSEIKVKVNEISETEIKYRKWDNLDGPIYIESRRDIVMIRYENGTNEIIYKETTPTISEKPAEETILFSEDYFWTNDLSILESEEELRYNDLKKFYDKSFYDELKDPYYSPARAWLSFLIPGLAQYTMGEPGLGTTHLLITYLGGGSLALAGGLLMADSAKYLQPNKNDSVGKTEYSIGVGLVVAGAVTFLAVGIGSIVNAVDVAKVKSLYFDDLEDYEKVQKPTVGLKLIPSVNYAYTPTGLNLCPSLGLHLTF